MDSWLTTVLLVLGAGAGLMVIGLAVLWLIIRTARPRRQDAGLNASWRSDFQKAAPINDNQASEIAAEIKALSSAQNVRGPGDGAA